VLQKKEGYRCYRKREGYRCYRKDKDTGVIEMRRIQVLQKREGYR
jgi:hypothetical protein